MQKKDNQFEKIINNGLKKTFRQSDFCREGFTKSNKFEKSVPLIQNKLFDRNFGSDEDKSRESISNSLISNYENPIERTNLSSKNFESGYFYMFSRKKDMSI